MAASCSLVGNACVELADAMLRACSGTFTIIAILLYCWVHSAPHVSPEGRLQLPGLSCSSLSERCSPWPL